MKTETVLITRGTDDDGKGRQLVRLVADKEPLPWNRVNPG